jgi:hypothetical protein
MQAQYEDLLKLGLQVAFWKHHAEEGRRGYEKRFTPQE